MSKFLLQKTKTFQAYWAIMEESFPQEERRSPEQFLPLLEIPDFKILLFCDENDTPEAFLNYWELEQATFVEHFAVHHRFRGKGKGQDIFTDFLKAVNGTIVLEVEPPLTEQAQRRIGFYQRNGFVLNAQEYFQPPYHENGQMLPLKLMSSPHSLSNEEFEEIKHLLYKKVYQKIL